MPKLEDFEVSAYLHSASTRKRPIWYGTVDGRGVTAPCWSKENAIRDAENSLKTGSCIAGLLDSIGTYKHWLKDERSEDCRCSVQTA